MHEQSSFVTLTYDDAHIPQGGTLHYPDVQRFFYRLRDFLKRNGRPRFRYFVCGEYGEQTFRPHYHALLFGYFPPDVIVRRRMRYGPVWKSQELARLWPLGHHEIGRVTPESAQYAASYTVKKISGPPAAEHYRRVDPDTGETWQLMPEFARMSLKPGIGFPWLDKYGLGDIYVHDEMIINGKRKSPPRAYDKKMRSVIPERMDDIQHARTVRALEHVSDNTHERLAVREVNAKAKYKTKVRQL